MAGEPRPSCGSPLRRTRTHDERPGALLDRFWGSQLYWPDDNGWEGCTFDEETVYVPLVVVPNAGMAIVSADVDIKLRLGQLGPNVRSPGILVHHELQVFEGVCEHRMPMAFVDLLEQWRRVCTGPTPTRPQTFLNLKGLDRLMSRYVHVAKRLLLDKLGPPVPPSVLNL
jgi:hypothetical protein